MKRDLYFKELAVVLGRAGFTPLPQEDDSLPVEYHSQRLCRINEQGNVFYRQEEVDSPEREKACDAAAHQRPQCLPPAQGDPGEHDVSGGGGSGRGGKAGAGDPHAL